MKKLFLMAVMTFSLGSCASKGCSNCRKSCSQCDSKRKCGCKDCDCGAISKEDCKCDKAES